MKFETAFLRLLLLLLFFFPHPHLPFPFVAVLFLVSPAKAIRACKVLWCGKYSFVAQLFFLKKIILLHLQRCFVLSFVRSAFPSPSMPIGQTSSSAYVQWQYLPPLAIYSLVFLLLFRKFPPGPLPFPSSRSKFDSGKVFFSASPSAEKEGEKRSG